MPDLAYLIPLEQRRRLAELYSGSPEEAGTPALLPAPEPEPRRCNGCGYLPASIGHQVTCGNQCAVREAGL